MISKHSFTSALSRKSVRRLRGGILVLRANRRLSMKSAPGWLGVQPAIVHRMPRCGSMALALLGLTLLAACSQMPVTVGVTSRHDDPGVEIDELRRLSVCNSATVDSTIRLIGDADALAAFEAQRGIHLVGTAPLTAGPYVLIELGQRATGGYAIALSHRATEQKNHLQLAATFFAPKPGQVVESSSTSPCVLIALPKPHNSPRYTSIALTDPAGQVRAEWSATGSVGAELESPAAPLAGPGR